MQGEIDNTIISGIAVVLAAIISGIFLFFSRKRESPSKPLTPEQNITGDNNTQIIGDGNTIHQNMSAFDPEIIKRLTELLKLKDVALEEKDKIIEKWVEQYNALQEQLASRSPSDELAQVARRKLANFDLAGAEALLKKSHEANMAQLVAMKAEQQTFQEAAAADAYNLADVKVLQLDYPPALEYYRKALELAPENTTYLNRLGNHLQTLGRYDEAIHFYEQALESNIQNLDAHHSKVATTWNNLGSAWHAKGQYNKAIEFYEKALKSNIKSFGEHDPSVATTRNNLGEAWRAKGQYNKAIEVYQKALESCTQNFGEDHPEVASIKGTSGK